MRYSLFPLVRPRVFTESEQVARSDIASIAFTLGYLSLSTLLLDADTRVVLAIAILGVAAWPFVQFSAVFGVPAGCCW